MREIRDHIVSNDLPQSQLTIQVLDEPGAGGACHAYLIGHFSADSNASFRDYPFHTQRNWAPVLFQNGPIKELGVNGVTQEALLAIVIDRLRSFQAGPFSCRENAIALTHAETALMWLQKRTTDRLRRGVEGTHQK